MNKKYRIEYHALSLYAPLAVVFFAIRVVPRPLFALFFVSTEYICVPAEHRRKRFKE